MTKTIQRNIFQFSLVVTYKSLHYSRCMKVNAWRRIIQSNLVPPSCPSTQPFNCTNLVAFVSKKEKSKIIYLHQGWIIIISQQ